MKRNLRNTLLASAATAMLVFGGGAAAASAVVMHPSVGTKTCTATGTSGNYTAVMSNVDCKRVQAKLNYISSGGSTYTVTGGASTSTSTATAATTMITSRAGRVSIMNPTEQWSTWGSY